MSKSPARRPLLFIDPETQYITVAKLRLMTRRGLRELRHPIIVTGGEQPTAIIMNYRQYLDFQENWIRAAQLTDRLSDQFERLMAQGTV